MNPIVADSEGSHMRPLRNGVEEQDPANNAFIFPVER